MKRRTFFGPRAMQGISLTVAAIFSAITISIFVPPATAQTAGALCIFSDAQGNSCTGLSDTQPELVNYYVVHTQAINVTSVEFSAPIPACMTGVAWLGDSSPWPLVVGDSQTGAAVSYGSCLSSPVHVMTVSLFGQGLTGADCPYSVRPHPLSAAVEAADCDNNFWEAVGGTTFINSTMDCWCDAATSAELSLSPSYLDFDAIHSILNFTISNDGGGVLTWAVAEAIPWLSVSSPNGSGNAVVSATVDRTGLDPGLHTGYIDVSSNGGFGSIGVTVAVTEGATLSVSPNPLDFGTSATSLPLSISNAGTGNFQWQISESIPWLTVSQLDGFADAVVDVNINRSGLAIGPHTAQFDVNSNGGTITVDVIMEVPDPGPVLSVSPSSFTFQAGETSKTLLISNAGTGTIDWGIVESDAWLSVSPSSGTSVAGEAPVSVNVAVDRAGLSAGTYNGTLQVLYDFGQEIIPVTMIVSSEPILAVSPTSLDFGLSQVLLPLTISNLGSGTLSWTITDSESWLSVVPTGGENDTTVAVNVDRTGLPGGLYTGTIDVTSNGGNASVGVQMQVPFDDGSAGTLCLFTDPAGSSCNFTDTPNSLVQIFVVHTGANNVLGVEFAAPIPPCYGGIFLGDGYPFPIVIGDSQNGVSVGYGACVSSPIHVLTINTLGLGLSQDCVYPVLPHPNNAFVEVFDCNQNVLNGLGGTAYFNSNQPCSCPPYTVPVLSVTPTSLNFGDVTENLNFNITNLGAGTLTWDVTEAVPWLTVSETSGSGNAVITASVDRTGLAQGFYSGQIDVTSNGGNATISVDMEVPGPPVLSVVPTEIFFGETSTIQIFNITNTGGGLLSWVLDEAVPWLDASPDSADGDATVAVTVDRTGLAPGTYMGQISVASNGGNETVTATMIVPQPQPVLSVTPTFASLAWDQDNFDLSVSNVGTGTLDWSVTPVEPWLSATPDNGSGNATVSIQVDRTGLSDGSYTGTLHVTSNGGDIDVTVFMSVLTSPVLSVTPTTLGFTSTSQTKLFFISNAGPGTLTWSLTPNQPWIDVAPASGSGPATINVTIDPDSLAGGTSGSVSVASNGGSATVNVHLVTVSAPGFLGVYADPSGSLCTAPDTPNGFLPVYVIHQATPGAAAVQAGVEAANPAGFVHLGETSPYPTTIGSMWVHDEGQGGSVAFGGCFGSPNLVKTINLLTLGFNPLCTSLCVIPDPGSLTGTIEVVDCANNKLIGDGACMWINTNPTCNSCGPAIAVRDKTWGQIKSLYVDWDTPQWRAKQKR